MLQHSLIPLWLLTVLSVFVSTEGFLWLGGSRKLSSERSQLQGMPTTFYRGDGGPWTQQYTYDSGVPPMTVALPLALPLPAQTSYDGVVIESAVHIKPACIHTPISTSPFPVQSSSTGKDSLGTNYFPMSHMGGLKSMTHPVQLVPCLCPISRDEAPQQQQQPQQQSSYVVQQQQQTAP